VGGASFGADYYAPNYSRMLVFGLNGKAQLPATTPYTPPALNPPPSTASADVIKAGGEKYGRLCSGCHGENGSMRGANFPDLTRSGLLYTQEGFDQVVLQGVREEKGMASFAKALTPEDSKAVREFIIARANEVKKNPPPMFGPAPSRNQHDQSH
jgi:alcohol dehydrogenase (cytochrome c)/quinohemoprotein ethanol dehydrogenase